MSMRKSGFWAIFAVICLTMALSRADEVDSLVHLVKPPARFKNHIPDFSWSRQSYTFNHAGGPKVEAFYVIKDGERYLGVIRENDGNLNIIDFYPEALPKTLRMPKGRYHLDTEIGVQFPTGGTATYNFSGGGKTLALERVFSTSKAKYRNHLVFRCDSVLGYVVDVERSVASATIPQNQGAGGILAPGTFEPWDYRARYQRVAFTPAGRPGIEGWFNNSSALDRGDEAMRSRPGGLTFRDGGFIALLDDSVHWSAAITRTGGGPSSPKSICNAHNSWFIGVDFPTDRMDEKGWYVFEYRNRYLGLPPEITQHIMKAMKVHFSGQSAVILRIGAKEDMEGQPVSLETAARGLYSTGGMKLSIEEAYSGKKSLVVKDKLRPNLPQVVLQPFSRYRCEAMMKAVGASTVAYITGKTFEWSPYGNVKWFSELESQRVKDGEGWKKVSFELTTAAWDPFIDIVFNAEGGTAYVDDFSFTKLGEVTALWLGEKSAPKGQRGGLPQMLLAGAGDAPVILSVRDMLGRRAGGLKAAGSWRGYGFYSAAP